MWNSHSRWKRLEKRVADLEVEVQSQHECQFDNKEARELLAATLRRFQSAGKSNGMRKEVLQEWQDQEEQIPRR